VRWKRFIVVVLFLAFLALAGTALSLNALTGAGRRAMVPLAPGDWDIAMDKGPRSLDVSKPMTQVGQAIVQHYADRELPVWPDNAKGTSPRIALAKLHSGRDVEVVNTFLLGATPWSNSGSTWWAHKGDYDFTEVTLTTILYSFGDDPERLHARTVQHMLDVLLIEEGGTPRIAVPRSLGLVVDTENHLLMTEGSRYLKNQWLRSHGNTDPKYGNDTNGLEEWMVGFLESIRDEGVYEFNSIPYLAYTTQALLNLEAFPESAEVRYLARYILDTINTQYALGSLDLRRCAPFRRQLRHADDTALDQDRHTGFMQVWANLDQPHQPDPPALKGSTHCGVLAEILPYRPPNDVLSWVRSKPHEYFVQFGRGAKASPELYSGGPGFLISAGGVPRGMLSHIASRPITLMLKDGATDFEDCFHIRGRGEFTEWNNTGVHERFACANGPVLAPERYQPSATHENWSVYGPLSNPPLYVVTYSVLDFGLLALFPEGEALAESVLESIRQANTSQGGIAHTFIWPSGSSLTYDVEARKGTWVLQSFNGEPVDRDYDAWPMAAGNLPAIRFLR
jgi:hypothetical protein